MISRHSAVVRPSHQSSAGRITVAVRVEKDRRVHLPGDADCVRDCRARARARAPCGSPPTRRLPTTPRDPAPPSPGCGVASWSGVIADATTSPDVVDENRLDAARPDVDAEEEWRAPLSALRAGAPSSADRAARTRSPASRMAPRSNVARLELARAVGRELHARAAARAARR